MRAVATLCLFALQSPDTARVKLALDTSEAEAVLGIVDKHSHGHPVSDADWQRLFSCEPYVRLKKREGSLRRELTDESFKTFVLSVDLAKRALRLRKTLEAWKRADLSAAAKRILPYLPATATVRASVYPVIKPQTNSFVFETTTNPAVFLYLDPEMKAAEFENTVAHESHHIGFASASKEYDEKIKALPSNARKAAEWMGAFGEGMAVLAAAGSPDLHPMAAFPMEHRIRWDQDMKSVDRQLADLDQFFQDLIGGGFAKPEVADHEAFTFFGFRGSWYTVGYRMGQVVEKKFGRAILIECMADPRMLLAKYNEAASEWNANSKEHLALWSKSVLKAVGVTSE